MSVCAELVGRPEYGVVAFDELGRVAVSTVWLGVARTPSDTFETVAFDGRTVLDERRYDTVADALAGHAEVVRALAAR